MNFNYIWFEDQRHLHERFLKEIDTTDFKVLEIGALEGMSTLFFLDNYNSKVSTIEQFCLSDKVNKIIRPSINNFIKNTEQTTNKDNLSFYRNDPCIILPDFIYSHEKFDYIVIKDTNYIKNIYPIAILCFKVLNDGGIMFFEEYDFHGLGTNVHNDLKSFIKIYRDDFEILYFENHFVIKKIIS